MESISIIFIFSVFMAGIFSFFSPCILPILPVYVGLLSSEKSDGSVSALKKYLKVLLFITGLSFSFFLMGFGAGALGTVLNNSTFFIICGVIVVFLGLHQTGLININFLNKQKTLSDEYEPKDNIISAFLLGFLFSFGWTPCVGPVLGAVIGVSSQQGGALAGGLLLLVYSLGLGIPFALLALGAKYLLNKVKKIYPYMSTIKVVGGILIIMMGLWMIFNQIKIIETTKKANLASINVETSAKDEKVSNGSFDFTLSDTEGNLVSLSDFKNKKIYIKFWATWCPSCLGGLDDYKALAKQYENSDEVVMLSIVAPNINGELSKEEFKEWAKAQNIEFKVLFDETDSVNNMFQVRGYPTSIFIDKNGDVAKKITGSSSNEDILNELSKIN